MASFLKGGIERQFVDVISAIRQNSLYAIDITNSGFPRDNVL
jgi:hypothetical protein